MIDTERERRKEKKIDFERASMMKNDDVKTMIVVETKRERDFESYVPNFQRFLERYPDSLSYFNEK